LDSVINFAASSPELQHYQQQQRHSDNTSAAAAAAAPAGGGVDLQGLAACLLPQLDVVELLQQVLDSFGLPPRKRKPRTLPFLGESCAHDPAGVVV
jgi:hypothetical protein